MRILTTSNLDPMSNAGLHPAVLLLRNEKKCECYIEFHMFMPLNVNTLSLSWCMSYNVLVLLLDTAMSKPIDPPIATDCLMICCVLLITVFLMGLIMLLLYS